MLMVQMPYYHTGSDWRWLSASQTEIDGAVRSRFEVKDAYLLPNGEYEYRVEYGPESKQRFADLMQFLAPLGLTPWLAGDHDGFVLTLRRTDTYARKASRASVVLALLTGLVLLVFSYFEVEGDQVLAPEVPGYVAFVGFGASIVMLMVARILSHRYFARRAGEQTNTSYLLPGLPGITASLPTLGFLSYQRGPSLNRDRYFDVMIAGPLALLAVSIVLQFVGDLTAVQSTSVLTSCLSVNPYVQVCPANPSVLQLGIAYLLGPLTPAVAAGHGLVSPLGDGATVGFLLAFIAILPMASFDGGQISNALWGAGRARVATYICVVVLLALDTNELLYWGVAIAVLLVGGRPLKLSFMDDASRASRRKLYVYLGLLVVAFLVVPIPHDIATIPLG